MPTAPSPRWRASPVLWGSRSADTTPDRRRRRTSPTDPGHTEGARVGDEAEPWPDGRDGEAESTNRNGAKIMSKPGKKTVDAQRRYDREQVFAPTEAIDLVKAMATRKFDETVEAAFRLGVDP